jgi:hypothetical protein
MQSSEPIEQEKQNWSTKLPQMKGQKITAEHSVVVGTRRYQARPRVPRATCSVASYWSVLNVHDTGDPSELRCGRGRDEPHRTASHPPLPTGRRPTSLESREKRDWGTRRHESRRWSSLSSRCFGPRPARHGLKMGHMGWNPRNI